VGGATIRLRAPRSLPEATARLVTQSSSGVTGSPGASLHSAQGVTALEKKLMKQAESMLARSQNSLDRTAHSNGVTSQGASERKGLIAALSKMALSLGFDIGGAGLNKDAGKAQNDAEYREAINDLLGRLQRGSATKSLPTYDGIVHQIPGKKSGGDVERNGITTSPWRSPVPREGKMDRWKEQVQKGLDAWRKTEEDIKDKEIAGVTDEQWKEVKSEDKKKLGDALTKHADANSWSEQMRKALDAARNEHDKTMRPVAPKISPASLTDAISTDCGLLRGVKIGAVRVFKGIPYAMPPTGPLRWAPPVARKAMSPQGVPLAGCWTGTLIADSFAKVATSLLRPSPAPYCPWPLCSPLSPRLPAAVHAGTGTWTVR
jgi:hypothetical protein